MLKSKTRWKVYQTDEQKKNQLAEQLNISPLLASLLVNRGMTEAEAAKRFLYDHESEFHDPFLFNDMKKAIDRIQEAIAQEEPILIFGDYDADGVSSTSVMMTVLTDLGANVDFYIPNRFTEGYGPNEQAFRQAKEQGYRLIITVDTGIAAVKEAKIAADIGLDLIITDHHEPGPELPEALAIIHPKLSEDYPFSYLAGVGVAFKTAHALYGYVPEHLLDLAAIGTVADLVPLVGENRMIAKAGIKKLQRTTRPGIEALLKLTSTKRETINEETIGFMIAPRINAAGRLADADPAVELMLTTEKDTAEHLAQEIDAMNKERQAIVSDIAEEAIRMVQERYPPEEYPVIVVGKEGWNAGVIGIVASRLVEQFYRPAIVLSFDPETNKAKGSARSIAGFDLFKNLSACRELLPHFGGHPMAAGMTLERSDVDELRERLCKAAKEQLTAEDLVPLTELDAVVPLEEISLSAIEQLNMLAPYGMNNPKPKVLIKKAGFSALRKIGADHTHLKIQLENEAGSLDGIGFGLGHYADHIAPFSKVSVIGELSVNEWNNIRKPQIFVKDLEVDEWQLFDMRGHRDIKRWMHQVPEERTLIVFREQTVRELHLEKETAEEVLFIDGVEKTQEFSVQGKNLVFLDLPPSLEIIEALIRNGCPARMYVHFHQKDSHFFSTMPTREHFKWLYAFLFKRKSFDLKKHGDALAAHRGWSRETIDFMSKVFFELDFVTINEGIVHLNEKAPKRDLDQSPAYQYKKKQLELENKLLYSSYQELKSWLDELVVRTPVENEEEMKSWI
ncbi:single-stranded-DNA-specific exonuclease RecJ [Bacillus thermotolerans]|uniref:Single-stranded-DNA-specific exonuclease RecJ n=1 Tax=Bacillus thermotolerans TaxID=1221996 RepID=A0A0F5IDL6_BACTR|nr:single-stranded-DNA-specific exonuclease RecJ [Bacillus thermotolerans]KKB43445.1 Single-stranded-DNA-specific exonuclease RecJ [Bacillus thermotolerans]